MKGWGCCYSGKGSRLVKMTLRHNRFLNINAVDQVLSRVEAIVRRFNPGAGNKLLSQLQEAETRIRRIRRFLPRNQYLELMRGLRSLISSFGSRERASGQYSAYVAKLLM